VNPLARNGEGGLEGEESEIVYFFLKTILLLRYCPKCTELRAAAKQQKQAQQLLQQQLSQEQQLLQPPAVQQPQAQAAPVPTQATQAAS